MRRFWVGSAVLALLVGFVVVLLQLGGEELPDRSVSALPGSPEASPRPAAGPPPAPSEETKRAGADRPGSSPADATGIGKPGARTTRLESIDGRIVDPWNRPLAEVLIVATPEGAPGKPSAFISEPDGRFRFGGLYPGRYQIRLHERTHHLSRWDRSCRFVRLVRHPTVSREDPDGSVELDCHPCLGVFSHVSTGARDLVLPIDARTSLWFRVIDAVTGEPIPEIRLEIRVGEWTLVPALMSEAHGRFAVLCDEVRRFEARCMAWSTNHASSPWMVCNLADGECRDDAVVRLGPGCVLMGRVVGTDGQPVPHYLIEVTDSRTGELVDARAFRDPEFGLAGLPHGGTVDLHVCALATPQLSRIKNVRLTSGTTSLGTVRLSIGGAVLVDVRDRMRNRPQVNVVLQHDRSHEVVRLSSMEVWRRPGLRRGWTGVVAPGPWWVRILGANGHVLALRLVNVQAGSRARVSFELTDED